MGRFDRQILQAKKQISRDGQTVTWRQISNGSPADSSKPWKPGDSVTVDKSVKIVFLSVNRVNERFLQMMQGAEIPEGALRGIMADEGFEPTNKDLVIRDGEVLHVKSVDPIAPNGQLIMYKLEFTRAS